MNRLRKARLNADKSQLLLMKETGIYYATISRLERGWVKPTDVQKAKLAKALGVDPTWLFPEAGIEGDDSERKIQ
jgi:transcriptional regulator with XRE-family HTH domain